MIVELGAGPPEPERLREVLARALDDPSADAAHLLPDRGGFVDAHGDPVAVGEDGRALTHLERDGARVAVLMHAPALLDEPGRVAAVAARAGPALEDERRHAEVRARLREVQASRARLVASADADRRRVERDLHGGAQQRLATVALSLTLARSRLRSAGPEAIDTLLDETGRELAGALEDLRELARGLYPVLLTDAGLGPALTALAERSPIPVVVTALPGARLPEAVERAVHAVVCEALANAAAHSGADGVRVDVRDAGGVTTVEVSDDGRGGADGDGPGLRGLADRVAATGGVLRVTSPSGGGTRLRAELPS